MDIYQSFGCYSKVAHPWTPAIMKACHHYWQRRDTDIYQSFGCYSKVAHPWTSAIVKAGHH
jgi:hypothetical protein